MGFITIKGKTEVHTMVAVVYIIIYSALSYASFHTLQNGPVRPPSNIRFLGRKKGSDTESKEKNITFNYLMTCTDNLVKIKMTHNKTSSWLNSYLDLVFVIKWLSCKEEFK